MNAHTARQGRTEAARFKIVLAGIMLVMSLAALDQNIVNTALPRIAADLGGASQLSWVISAFLLTATLAMPLYGKLADVFGRRSTLLTAIGLFLTASTLCGLARSMGELIAFRALQGLGGGGLITLALIVIGDLVPPIERPRYQGLFAAVFGFSSVAGPVIGGALTTALSWRWVFYINLPIGGLAMALVLLGLGRIGSDRRHAIDYVGALLLAMATTAILTLLNFGLQLHDVRASGGLAAAAVLLSLLFVWREGRAVEPILDLRLFRNHSVAVACMAAMIIGFAMMGALVFLPVYLQLVRGQTPFQAGLVVTPQVLGLLLSGVIGGRMISKVGRLKPFLIGGAALAALSVGLMSVAVALAAPLWVFALLMVGLGLGIGLVMPNTITLVQNAVAPQRIGEATGAINFARSLGSSAGVALSGGLVAARVAAALGADASAQTAQMRALVHRVGAGARAALAADPAPRAYRHAIGDTFLLSTVILAAAFALVCTLPDDRLRGRAEPSAPPESDTAEAVENALVVPP